jgi:hypothetical protein
MLWLKRWQARRDPAFRIEVQQEIYYLRTAFGEEARSEAQRRLHRRKLGSFEWCVIAAAIKQLRS